MSEADDARAMARRDAGPGGALTLSGVLAALDGQALWCPDDSLVVTGVVAADLMSDVLVDARPGFALVTGLVNVQVIRTAAVADVAAVVFVRGKAVPPDVVDLARQMNVAAITSRYSLFEAAGRLYALLGVRPERAGQRQPA